MSFVIDTPDGIEFVRLGVFCGRLMIEVNTGMTSRVNTAKNAREYYKNLPEKAMARSRNGKVALLEELNKRKEFVLEYRVVFDSEQLINYMKYGNLVGELN